MPRTVHAVCPHDCPDACGILIHINDAGTHINDAGTATRLQGDPAHPVTRGFLCAKVTKYIDRVYSPDRLLYPMKRTAPKGQGGPAAFTRITWDEALDTVSARLKQISSDFGAESILPYSYAGNLAVLGYASMDQRFFHRLGASQLDRTICSTAGGEALVSVYGKKFGTEPEQFRHAKYIIAWASNIHGNNVHLWPFIEEARRNGAKLVVIDPYKTRTARISDWHIAINPGTDAALALSLMHVIISEGLLDSDYVQQHVFGFDELRKRAAEFPPERAAAVTGIPARDIITLAREYATTRPAVIRVNYGVQRCENGGMNTRAIAMLPCLIGSWKEVGGGLQLSTSGAFALNKQALTRPDLQMKSPLGRPARVVNMSSLGEALNNLAGPPVKAIFVYNSNPAAVAPNHNAVVRGFSRPDLFTVVHEQFFTDTTDYADVILPATTFFEHKDIVSSYGHYYMQLSHAAIAPLGEAKPNVEMFSLLAHRMGCDDACFRDSVDDLIEQALDTDNAMLAGITRDQLEREPHVRLQLDRATTQDAAATPFLPFANGFPTHNGKALFYNESLAAQGLDPVVSFIPPRESRHGDNARARKFPLEMLARKADNYLNSTFCNLPATQKMEEMGMLELSTADAAARNISDGDPVRVFNDRGEITLHALASSPRASTGPNSTPTAPTSTSSPQRS